MSKKINKKAIIVIVLLVVGISYFGGLFSVVAQEREIGDYNIVSFDKGTDLISKYGSTDKYGLTNYKYIGSVTCPEISNGTDISSCKLMWEGCYEKTDILNYKIENSNLKLGMPWHETYLTFSPEAQNWINIANNKNVGQLSLGIGETGYRSYTGGLSQVYFDWDLVYFGSKGKLGQPMSLQPKEKLDIAWTGCNQDSKLSLLYTEKQIQCPDGSYNYRSMCPKPITCSDGTTVYAPNICPTTCPDGSTVYAPNVCKVEPPKPPAPIWETIWNQISDFFAELFKNIRFFSMTGSQTVAPNSVNQYVISLPAPSPIDYDWSDGKYQFRYGGWSLADSKGNIIQKGDWENINNSYEKTVNIIAPSNPQDYALIAVIYEYNYVYDTTSNTWKITNEGVITKEGINILTKISVNPPTPLFPDFTKIIRDTISGFFSWFLNIFNRNI